MAQVPAEDQLEPSERAAIAMYLDILLSIGATWDNARMELFRVTMLEGAPFRRVPSYRTCERILLEHFGYTTMADYKEKRKESLKVALKNKAVHMALSGNVPMLIFCLKNLCQWADTVQAVPDPESAKNQIRLAYDPKSI